MTSIVTAKDLTLKTPTHRVLFKNLHFDLNPGQLLHVQGCNGSGKSTLLKALVGSYQYYSGEIHLNIQLSDVSLLPQMGNLQFLFPFTLREVINTKVAVSDQEILSLGFLTEEALNLSWNTASGGERQKALLSRAVLKENKLLILDEPYNHLDEDSKKNLDGIIKKHLFDKKSVILNSHDSLLSAQLPSQIIKLGKEDGC